MAAVETNPTRKAELLQIAANCENVPANGATNFYEACQSFIITQMILQVESSGHSESPGRFDQYMYPVSYTHLDVYKRHVKSIWSCCVYGNLFIFSFYREIYFCTVTLTDPFCLHLFNFFRPVKLIKII